MATALSKADQVHMMELFKAFSAKDAPGMADATLAFSGTSQSCPDPLGLPYPRSGSDISCACQQQGMRKLCRSRRSRTLLEL